MKRRIKIRRAQKAFHPNATQFTMQLGEALFGFWRQSLDRDQSVFAIHNVTDTEVRIPAVSLNLIGGDAWIDLLTGERLDEMAGATAPDTPPSGGAEITFAPYQCRWISNRGGGI